MLDLCNPHKIPTQTHSYSDTRLKYLDDGLTDCHKLLYTLSWTDQPADIAVFRANAANVARNDANNASSSDETVGRSFYSDHKTVNIKLVAVLWECLRVGHKYSLLAVAVGCYGNEAYRASFLFDEALLWLLQNTNDPNGCFFFVSLFIQMLRSMSDLIFAADLH